MRAIEASFGTCLSTLDVRTSHALQLNEPLPMTDLASSVERLSPRGAHYRQDEFGGGTVNKHVDECPNDHSHCQHLVLGTSQTIPIVDGRMTLGQWQRIFAIELDEDKASQIDSRQVDVQAMSI